MQETTITVLEIQEFSFGQGKKGWNLQTAEGDKYACFSSTEMGKITPMEPVKIRYEIKERNGYENRNIKQVADENGNFPEKPAGGSGGRVAKADPDKLKQERELEIARNQSIQRQVAVKAAVELVVSDKIKLDELDTYYDKFMDKLTTPWSKKQ